MVTEALQELGGWSESPTSADAISSALHRIWRRAGRPVSESDGRQSVSGAVLRTRVVNMLAYFSSSAEVERSERVLAELSRRHPIRSLLLSPRAGSDALGASVRVFCHPSMGRRVCFEQIQLSVGGRVASQLPSVISQLLVHDLPTLLWWPGSPPFASPLFSRLVGLADLLVCDSGEFRVPARGLAALADGARPLRGRTAIADLNWNRLSDWRELVAQFFDLAESRSALERLRAVEIEVATAGGSAASAQALLLAGWLGSRLGWKPGSTHVAHGALVLRMRTGRSPVEVRLVGSRSGSGTSGAIRAVRIDAGAGGGAQRFCVESDGDAGQGTASSELGAGRSSCRCFALQERTEAELLAEEVETLGREHALDDALEFAGQIVAGLEH